MRSLGLDFKSVKELLAYRAELESLGFNFEALKELLDVAKRYGGRGEVFKALLLYGELRSIEAERALSKVLIV